MEGSLSRVINPETAGKERMQWLRALVLAVRELARQTEPNQAARDAAAFIALALESVHATIDGSVAAWEKRDYWVKADRFRMEWDWTRRYASAMRQAVLKEDWAAIAKNMLEIAARLNHVKVPQRNKLGTPWVGAHRKLLDSMGSGVS
jgi:hypothetical protein